ncbi:fused MFS/spermidine synthase [[Haemophilus] ducreyi]|nr:fused MFS/spermidine synthase [[Haemophilus] ducreyi]
MTKKAILLSFLGGFLSLSLEVIWIRLLGFQTFSLPQAFSFTLALFLLGIAFGSFIGKKVCQQGDASINYIGRIFFIAALFDCLAIGLISTTSNSFTNLVYSIFSIFCCALLRGIVFPIVHHLGSEHKKTGAAISNVYFANVLGCTIAPIFIGFYLLDQFTTQQTYLIVISITLIIACFCLTKRVFKAINALFAISVVFATALLPEKMISTLANEEDMQLETLIENKHGIIQVYLDKNQDHLVYGSNVYDGQLNVNLNHNSNGIHRAYLLPVIAPKVKNILVVGLSTGSWVKVLTSMPNLESITVVELNPAYVQLASSYPAMADLLKDNRVNIITDDGRRWLNKNPDQKFDLILMNTTFHWRNYATNLLSQQFLTVTKQHLTDNGFIYFNTTDALDAYKTSQAVFPHVYAYENMSSASLKPIAVPTTPEVHRALANLKWHDGRHIFNSPAEIAEGTARIVNTPLIPYKDIDFSPLKRPAKIITDTNMITEYKYGRLNTVINK